MDQWAADARPGEGRRSSGPRDQGSFPTPDPNRAEWLDLAHSDQAFEEWAAVVEDSSLGLTLTEAEPLGRRVRRRPER